MYKKKELESIFIEVINPKSENLIIGCIFDVYMSDLLQKISKEDKTIMLMGDFDIDLLKFDTNADSTAFLDSTYAILFLPYITTPTRVTTHSKALIEKIFLNNIENGLISGNIISTISDHFAQFLLEKDIKIDKSKPNLFQHNF